MKKQALRQQYRALRKGLSPIDFRQRCEQIVQGFLATISLQGCRYVHVFLPIQKQFEIDTYVLIEQLKQAYPALSFVVPRVVPDTFEMEHYLYHPAQLLENAWGIPEPDPTLAERVEETSLDVVIIPMLVCDLQGNRVGYGKGFYDRFLEKCRPDVLKIGLCLEPPVDCIADAVAWDVRLNTCICPTGSYTFG